MFLRLNRALLLLAPWGLGACHYLAGVDFEIANDGSGGTVGETTAASVGGSGGAMQTSTSTITTGGAGGTGGAPGVCLAPEFHVDFDEEDTSGWLESTLHLNSDSATRVTTSARHGAGAWGVALPSGKIRSYLESTAIDSVGEEYWFGLSQLHQGPALTDGTRTFSFDCLVTGDPYQNMIFGLEMLKAKPSKPFFAIGKSASTSDPDVVVEIDDLDDIPETGAYVDWVFHLEIEDDQTGYFEVFHDRVKVFRSVGDFFASNCNGGFLLRAGLYRWQATPPAQGVVLDEFTLLRGSFDEADVFHTLDPDAGCFD